MKGLKIYLVLIYAVTCLLLIGTKECCRHKIESKSLSPSETLKGPSDGLKDNTKPVAESDPTLPPVKESFNAEVVMCIDATGSMDGILNTVKENALNLYPDIKREGRKEGKDIKSMRVKVIAFRDFEDNNRVKTFEKSNFYNLPDQEADFKSFVSKLAPHGGGDTPELGLDAIAMAMKSDWNFSDYVRKIIILWTDAPTKDTHNSRDHGLSGVSKVSDYWNTKFSNSDKIFLFTPQDETWSGIESGLKNAVRHNVAAGKGLSDMEYKEIIRAISEDI